MRITDVPDLRRIPVLAFLLSAAAGVLGGLYCEIPASWLIGACAVVFVLTAFFIWLRTTSSIVFICSLIFILLFTGWRTTEAISRDVRQKISMWSDGDSMMVVTGHVWLPASDSYGSTSLVLSPVSVWSDSVEYPIENLRIRVYADSISLANLRFGDWIYARGSIESSINRTTSAVGSLITMLAQREGARLSADKEEIIVVRSGSHTIRGMVDWVRLRIRHSFQANLTPDAAALCGALLIGDRHQFGSDFSEKLRITGLSHVFALSGVNVGIVVSFFWLLTGITFLPRVVRLWILLVVILFYMELGREAPSLIRASLMVGLYILSLLLNRQATVFNTIASAAFLELLWRPLDCLDAGFLLSYLSVLGLVSSYQFFRSLFQNLKKPGIWRPLGSIWDVVASTMSAQAATLPLVGFLFRRIPLFGALGNIVAVPLFGLMLVLTLALVLLLALLPPAAVPVIAFLNGLSWFLGRFVDVLAHVPFAGLTIPSMPLVLLFALYACIALVFVNIALGRKPWIAVSTLLLACLIAWSSVLRSRSSECTISFIYVGNGDAALISTPSDRNILIDTGPTYGAWSAASRIFALLNERQIHKLDAAILTHPDMDHIGGTADLLSGIPVDRFFINGDSSDTRTLMITRKAAERHGLALEQLRAGDRIDLDRGVFMTVLSPDSGRLFGNATENQKSLVLRLECKTSSALLPSDIDSTVEHDLIAWGARIQSDLLKVAHHGSKTATCSDFVRAVNPTACVISCGPNIHGHPHPLVFKRLAAQALHPDVTWTSGTLTYTARNGSWTRVVEPAQRLIAQWHLPV